MKLRRILTFLVLLACLCGPSMADTARPGLFRSPVYVAPAPIPTSPTAAFTAPTDVYMVAITNTNSSTQATVTVQCTTGSVVFIQAVLNGVSGQGNHLVVAYPDGLSCQGGVTWSSSVSGVTGTITGRQ